MLGGGEEGDSVSEAAGSTGGLLRRVGIGSCRKTLNGETMDLSVKC